MLKVYLIIVWGCIVKAQRSAENAYRSPEAALAADIRSVFQCVVEEAERSNTRQLSMHLDELRDSQLPK